MDKEYRKIKRPPFDPFVKAKENREALSKEYRERFEAGEEKAIFDFIQIDKSNIREQWVLDEVMEWIEKRDVRMILRLGKRLKQPFHTELLGRERDELERNLSLLSLVRDIMKQTHWSQTKTVDVLWDIYSAAQEEEDSESVIEYAEGQYPQIAIDHIHAFLKMDLFTVKGKRKKISEGYFKDLIRTTKRLKKYSQYFPYLQK